MFNPCACNCNSSCFSVVGCEIWIFLFLDAFFDNMTRRWKWIFCLCIYVPSTYSFKRIGILNFPFQSRHHNCEFNCYVIAIISIIITSGRKGSRKTSSVWAKDGHFPITISCSLLWNFLCSFSAALLKHAC